ncbi:MAG: LysR family transcriptional regulator [Panacagrimonas sp.]
MNLKHLAIFRAVAQTGSVSGGAARLFISQSAVSKQLADFEAALGLPLFDRLPRGVRLTQAGRVLLGHANRLFAVEAQASRALADLKGLASGNIAIGASRTIGSYLLPQRLANFHSAYPGIALQLRVDNSQIVEQLLVDGEIDLAFTEGPGQHEQLQYRAFMQDALVLIANPDHAYAHAGEIRLKQLTQVPILMHEPGSGTRDVTEKQLMAKGVQVRPVMTLASTEAIKQTVAAGAGLAFISALSIDQELRNRTLKVVRIKQFSITRPLYQVRLKSLAPSPANKAFLTLFSAQDDQTVAALHR